MSWSILVRNVTKRFGERVILDNISLTIPPGETVALLGPSGGGKSTLIRCLNGLNTFDTGELQVGRHRLSPGNHRRYVGEVRRSFGMIFQDFQLFPHLNVLDNVIEAPMRVLRLPAREARERAMRLLDRVGMSAHANAYPQ